jgi:Dihydroorotate dehydrogenase
VLDAAEAVKRIKNGASFVQIYTGFIANVRKKKDFVNL